MITIRNDQADAMASGDAESLNAYIIKHLREEYYDYVTEVPADLLKPMVEHGLNKARSYGFSSTEHLILFVVLMFTFAPNFDEQPQIKAILTNENLSPEKRIEQMKHDDMNAAWAQAEEEYDDDAWGPEDDD